MKKIDNIELTRLLFDSRRMSIFDIAKEAPITVSQMAEKLNEKPSRLYYHVKLLEDAGLLELVETRQHGNLIEKYFKAVDRRNVFDLDPKMVLEHSEEMLKHIMNVLEPGLKLLTEEMKKSPDEQDNSKVMLSIMMRQLTRQDWKESHNRMQLAIGDGKPDSGEEPDEESNSEADPLSPEEQNRKSKYAYFLLSYRVDD